jgi:glyoxylase-like metal-dependent hydrolase (beta-lactamase superfamily II)
MILKKIKVGYLETNCYILIKDKDALIIDPGDEYEKIIKETKNLNILGILITHHHFDHVGALNNFKNIEIYDSTNLEEKEYSIKKFKFKVIKTKGHTDDSISFYFEEEKIMFVGDFVFKNSIGRTDLETGNYEEMKKSIKKIKTYPKNTKIYPGHGEETTLEMELKNNPYF